MRHFVCAGKLLIPACLLSSAGCVQTGIGSEDGGSDHDDAAEAAAYRAVDRVATYFPTEALLDDVIAETEGPPGNSFGLHFSHGGKVFFGGPVSASALTVSSVTLLGPHDDVLLRQEFASQETRIVSPDGDSLHIAKVGVSTRLVFLLRETDPVAVSIDPEGSFALDLNASPVFETANQDYGREAKRSGLSNKSNVPSQSTNCDAIASGVLEATSIACDVREALTRNLTEQTVNRVCISVQRTLQIDQSINDEAALTPERNAQLKLGVTFLCEALKRSLGIAASANPVGLACTALSIAGDAATAINGRPLSTLICDLFDSNPVTLTVVDGNGTGTYVPGEVAAISASSPPGFAFVAWTGDVDLVADPYSPSTTVELLASTAVKANYVRLDAGSPVDVFLPATTAQLSVAPEFFRPPGPAAQFVWSTNTAVSFSPISGALTTATVPPNPGEFLVTVIAYVDERAVTSADVTIQVRDQALGFNAQVDPTRASVLRSCDQMASFDVVLSGTWDATSGYQRDQFRIDVRQFAPSSSQPQRSWASNAAARSDGTWQLALDNAFDGFDAEGQYEFDVELIVRATGQILGSRTVFFELETTDPQLLSDVSVTGAGAVLRTRDFGAEDGDRVMITVNCEVAAEDLLLTSAGAAIDLPLRPGSNRIEIVALNEGAASPNTAGFSIGTDTQQWSLITGQIATLNVHLQLP